MGSGMAQVGVLVLLTVVVLPCCFFTLLALLDRFERSLAPTLETPAALAVADQIALAVEPREQPAERELVTLDVAMPRVAVNAVVASPAPAAV